MSNNNGAFFLSMNKFIQIGKHYYNVALIRSVRKDEYGPAITLIYGASDTINISIVCPPGTSLSDHMKMRDDAFDAMVKQLS